MTEVSSTHGDGVQPCRSPVRQLLPHRLARIARRATAVFALGSLILFLIKYETRWVPLGMNTVEAVPGGSWVVVDRWCSGMRVGSDVFVETPHGELVSRVEALAADSVRVRNPSPASSWGDSRDFGPLPIEDVVGTIVVVLAPDGADRGR